MALTGPVEAPLAFNTIFEVDDLIKFLTKTQMDLDTRFDVITGMIKYVEVDGHGHLRFDNVRKMLENVVTLCEDIALSMGVFSDALVKKKLIKRNTSLPHIRMRKDQDHKKKDSGIDSEKVSANWSYASDMSFMNSENRLSVFEEDSKSIPGERKVSFELMSPSQSSDVLDQQVVTDGLSLPKDGNETSFPSNDIDTSLQVNETSFPVDDKSQQIKETSYPVKQKSLQANVKSFPTDRNSNPLSADFNERTDHEDTNGNSLLNGLDSVSPEAKKRHINKVYVHLIPTDSSIDLSSIQEKLIKFSNSLIPENIELELVTSEIIIDFSPRHISTSTDSQTNVKNGFNRGLNNLSRFAVENSETSEEDNRSIRLISSSDSDTSFKRYHLKPVIEKKTVETQTDG